MLNPEIFLNWLYYAIDKVESGYFSRHERIYCYELYHRIRVAMWIHEKKYGKLEHIFLHGEAVKVCLSHEQAAQYDLYSLGSRYSPDFLLHSPASGDRQLAIMEVKATPNINHNSLKIDLEKLTVFKRNYKYQLAIFHCINNSLDHLIKELKKIDIEDIDDNIIIITKLNTTTRIQSITTEDIKRDQKHGK